MLRKGLSLVVCFLTLALAQADWDLLMDARSKCTISKNGVAIGGITSGYYLKGWQVRSFEPVSYDTPPEGVAEGIGGTAKDDAKVAMKLNYALVDANTMSFHFTFTPDKDVEANSIYANVSFNTDCVVGRPFLVKGKPAGVIPEQLAEQIHLFSGSTDELALETSEGLVRITLPKAQHVLLQDSRKWGSAISVRIGAMSEDGELWQGNKPYEVAFNVNFPEKIAFDRDVPFTLTANDDWIPLDTKLDIVPGSALDLTAVLKNDAPAGKHGYLRAVGQNFEFTAMPGVPQRFYGVNFCFSAHNITPAESEILAERLSRLGYNAVRYHHYERNITRRDIPGDSTQLDPVKMAQFDAMFAALKKRGLYATTDTYVSRDVYASEIWPGQEGTVNSREYKRLCAINENAFASWEKFTRNLLTHVNPLTGLSYAQDPSLAFICLINEGTLDGFGHFTSEMRPQMKDEWLRAWNAWLGKNYASAAVRDAAWGFAAGELVTELPAGKSEQEQRDFDRFFADTEIAMFRRMKDFIRNELGCQALLSDMNHAGKNPWAQVARNEFDYVDDHFYVDHPSFLKTSWALPSRCSNSSVVKRGVMGGSGCGFSRLLDKPFTITEWNYSGPGRYRGVGGILTGCMAALQNWSGLWRFAYSHSNSMFSIRPAGYFDLVSDPLNQAADRASIFLYLRGDLASAERTVAVTIDQNHLQDPDAPRSGIVPRWQYYNVVAKVGTFVGDSAAAVPADVSLGLSSRAPKAANRIAGEALGEDAAQAIDALFREKGWLPAGNKTDPSQMITESANGQFLIHAPSDTMVLNTPRTAGGFAPADQVIDTAAVTIKILDTDATVWVSSLSDQPIVSSKRLLITHLTDLQNEGARFMERARQTTLAFGKNQHLVRNGRAEVTLKLAEPAKATVWLIDLSGKQIGVLPSRVTPAGLAFDLAVKGPAGAQMLYEVTVE